MSKQAALSEDTATAHLRGEYQQSVQNITAEIQAREGDWNQDRGTINENNYNNYSVFGGPAASVDASGNPVSSGGGGTNAMIEKMVTWAIGIANDDSHGYSQASRTGNPDYDCSSLVYYALEQAGFGVISKRGYAGTTATIEEDLNAIGGWQTLTINNGFTFQRGDILWRDGHVAIAISATEEVAAHGVSFGSAAPGDQGTEISTNTFKPSSYTKVFRCTIRDESGGAVIGDMEKAISFAEKRRHLFAR